MKAFQNANEMEATGQLDKKTAEAIQTKIIEKIRSGENDLQLQSALKLMVRRNTGSLLPVFCVKQTFV